MSDAIPAIDTSSAPCAYLLTGLPGSGKSTVARALAARLPRAACIEADLLQAMLVSGGEWPTPAMSEEARRQLFLRARNAAALANSFASAGFVPVIDHIVISREQLAQFAAELRVRPFHLVVLAPPPETVLARNRLRPGKDVGQTWTYLDTELRRELSGSGVWIDSADLSVDEVVERIITSTV